MGDENTKKQTEEDRMNREQQRDKRIEETGQVTLDHSREKHRIHLLSIIGEVEGHDNLNGQAKTTKYEHVLPQLAAIEDSDEIQGVLVLLNTMGGDVEAGLAIAVSTDYSFIVPTGTMVIHPVRMTGMVIGVPQTFDYFKQMQDRITGFVCSHCGIGQERLEELMMETGILTKDVGTILVGQQTVEEGIINEVGGIREALAKLHYMIKNCIHGDKAGEK